ncbi:hypothetical protein RJT34_21794 [Clitoria ternatea]|uniref:Uncharacterized protein n=1 Tax=Clitoria ternatea TaxID=43366 RepID=A0AAN9IUZ0_CLITE
MSEIDFSNLPYLQCVAKEAMRLHPPTPLMLPHRANANVKIGGYDIPKGSNVHVNVWAVARDSVVWKDPLEFRPERFLEEDVDIKGHDFRLLPFGAGRRVCPGAQLGINLVTSMLGHLLHHFWWAPPEGIKSEDIDMGENPGLWYGFGGEKEKKEMVIAWWRGYDMVVWWTKEDDDDGDDVRERVARWLW